LTEKHAWVAIPVLLKPITHLFTGEKHSLKYRQFLSDPNNFKLAGSFRALIDNAIAMYEKLNPEGMDLRPPIGMEPAPRTDKINAVPPQPAPENTLPEASK
jgi:hypothetical protein